jgi:para-aminobenzoate synthetase component I
MRVVPLALRRDPLDVLSSLADEPGAFLADVADPACPVTILGCRPTAELRVLADGRVLGPVASVDALDAVEEFVAATAATGPFPLGAVVGYLAYEFGRFTAPRVLARSPDVPLAVLRRYETVVLHDRTRGQWSVVHAHRDAGPTPWLERLAAPARTWDGRLAAGRLAPLLSHAGYVVAARRILDYLAAGDAYQVNLTQPFTAPLGAPAWAVFVALARHHPVPHRVYLDLGDARLLVNSPELFLRRRDDRLETRPIKGTRPRGDGRAADAALAAELSADAKERAEHVMIVDLERNDLGRVCRPGSITVDPFCRVESHPSVHHLVSRVAGRLRPGVGLAEILRATFPGGSITGAPKTRAMEIIAELETWPRGAYTGAVGLFHPGGDLELALAIRTAVVARGALRWDAGGGIVTDSEPERELAEAWLKTAALRRALGEDAPPARELCSSG